MINGQEELLRPLPPLHKTTHLLVIPASTRTTSTSTTTTAPATTQQQQHQHSPRPTTIAVATYSCASMNADAAAPAAAAASPTPLPVLVLLFAHANGLCKEVWEPVIARLLPGLASSGRFATVVAHAWDNHFSGDSARWNGHLLVDAATTAASGAGFTSGGGPIPQLDWGPIAVHAAAVARWARTLATWRFASTSSPTLPPPPIRVIGVGHSIGGHATIRSEEEEGDKDEAPTPTPARPKTIGAKGRLYDGIVALEPIVKVPGHAAGRSPDYRMAAAAWRRKGVFDSKAEVHDGYAKKGFFASWHPDALRLYVEHGMEEVEPGHPDAGKVRLKCLPTSEAAAFHELLTWQPYLRLDEIMCPVRIYAGSKSELGQFRFGTKRVLREELLAARLRNGSFKLLSGVSHMMVADDPVLIAREISESIEWILAGGNNGRRNSSRSQRVDAGDGEAGRSRL